MRNELMVYNCAKAQKGFVMKKSVMFGILACCLATMIVLPSFATNKQMKTYYASCEKCVKPIFNVGEVKCHDSRQSCSVMVDGKRYSGTCRKMGDMDCACKVMVPMDADGHWTGRMSLEYYVNIIQPNRPKK